MENHEELKKYLAKERVRFSEIRMEFNRIIEKELARIDGEENKLLKQEESTPVKIPEKAPPCGEHKVSDGKILKKIGALPRDNKGTPERE